MLKNIGALILSILVVFGITMYVMVNWFDSNGVIIHPTYGHAVAMCGVQSKADHYLTNDMHLKNYTNHYILINKGHEHDHELKALSIMAHVECNNL